MRSAGDLPLLLLHHFPGAATLMEQTMTATDPLFFPEDFLRPGMCDCHRCMSDGERKFRKALEQIEEEESVQAPALPFFP